MISLTINDFFLSRDDTADLVLLFNKRCATDISAITDIKKRATNTPTF